MLMGSCQNRGSAVAGPFQLPGSSLAAHLRFSFGMLSWVLDDRECPSAERTTGTYKVRSIGNVSGCIHTGE